MELLQGSVGVARFVGVTRIGAGVVVLGVLAHTFGSRIVVGDGNPFDYFGYFTNSSCLLMSLVLVIVGVFTVRDIRAPAWLIEVRAVGVACLILVAVIYNAVVPGTGTAPAWVSVVLHILFPLIATLDWSLIGDRPALPWRRLWVVLPYPMLWLAIVLVRGATDGWVPYGFLLPERGGATLILAIVGLLAGLTGSAVLVWAAARMRGIRIDGFGRPTRECGGSRGSE